MIKHIFVFCGYKGSGKDTSSNFFTSTFSEPIKHLSFAEKLKEVCWLLFEKKLVYKDRIWGEKEMKELPIEGWYIHDKIREQCGFTEYLWSGRRLLQWFGTEVCRYAYEDIWVDKLLESIHNSDEDILTITDCRFLSEYESLKKLDKTKYKTVFVLIHREMKENQFSTHASEKEIEDFVFDYRINNNSTLEDLQDKVLSIKKFINK